MNVMDIKHMHVVAARQRQDFQSHKTEKEGFGLRIIILWRYFLILILTFWNSTAF